MKRVHIILSEKAEIAYKELNEKADSSKEYDTLLKSINSKIELIQSNVHYGQPVSKSKFPKEYLSEYNISNLFHVRLANYWRMLYTLTNNDSEVEIIAFVLDIVNHKEYDKKFGY